MHLYTTKGNIETAARAPKGRKLPGILLIAVLLIPSLRQEAVAAGDSAAHWNFEGTGSSVADLSGNGNAGVPLNGPTPVAGKVGQAFSFDGHDDLVLIDNPSFDGRGDLTIAAWIRPRGDAGHTQGYVFGGPNLAFLSERQHERICFTSDMSRYDCTPFGSLKLGVWQHIAVVRDAAGTSVELYLDGALAQKSNINNPPLANAQFAIGNHPRTDGRVRPFAGLIDEVRVYGRRLSGAQIQDLVQNVQSGSPATATGKTAVKGEALLIGQVAQTWQTVPLANSYSSAIVVCAPQYLSADSPALVQVRNVSEASFQVRLALMAASGAIAALPVHCLAVEEGVYSADQHGVTMEAVRFVSTRTDYASSSWVGEQRAFANSYAKPVVVGQVMTANDPKASVFWARGASARQAPAPGSLWVGKHVGEDPVTHRADELVGYLAVEAGPGRLGGLVFEAGLTPPAAVGIAGGGAPYPHVLTSVGDATIAVLSSAGMKGYDGAWPVFFGASAVSGAILTLGVDEDTFRDAERTHTAEEVAFLAFSASSAPQGGANPDGGTSDSGSGGGGTGGLRVERIGETGRRDSSPRGQIKLGSSSPVTGSAAQASGLANGVYAVHATHLRGLSATVGTCSYPQGGTECAVASFPGTPSCDGAFCTASVSVEAKRVTKVVFKYEGKYEGFAGSAVGGRNGAVIRVTDLSATGTGSLQAALDEACTANNRYIVFDVGGELIANTNLRVCGRNVTIDGFTAPTPITLRRTGLHINLLDRFGQERYAEDIIIRGLRIRKDNHTGPLGYDGHGVVFESGNSHYKGTRTTNKIVFAHNSVSGAANDVIGIARRSRDITFTGNIISYPGTSDQLFIVQDAHHISLYRNILTGGIMRVPLFAWHNPPYTDVSPYLNGDMRNNLIGLNQRTFGSLDSTADGSSVARGSKANIVNNFYVGLPSLVNSWRGIDNAIIVCNPFANWVNPKTSPYCGEGSFTAEVAAAGGAYVHGNVVKSAYNPDPAVSSDLLKTQGAAYPAAPVGITDAFTAACRTLGEAGVGAPDAHDQSTVEEIRRELRKFGPCAN